MSTSKFRRRRRWFGRAIASSAVIASVALMGGTSIAEAAPQAPGYWMVASDGGVFSYGSAPFLGSAANDNLGSPVVGVATSLLVETGGNPRYDVVTQNGQTESCGAGCDIALDSPSPGAHNNIVGIADNLHGRWLVDSAGQVFTFGDAPSYGSLTGQRLAAPIVGITATSDNGGYWLVAADGGVFSFGDASFYGSLGGEHLNQPIVGMTPVPNGGGYWLVAADGGVFSFGSARFYGSTGSLHLNAPVIGIAATSDGGGYWLAAADGGIFTFGSALLGF